MSKPQFVGIDYSLTSPCVCVYDSAHDFTFNNINFYYLTSVKKEEGKFGLVGNIEGFSYPIYGSDEERYDRISKWAMKHFDRGAKVGIEGYSMGSRGRVFNLAENCGILKWKLWESSFQTFTHPPTVIKKYATGKGNADKQKMYDAFVTETGVDLITLITSGKKLGNPVTDIVDAYYIMKYTMEHT